MPPERPLSPSILAALGLVAAPSCSDDGKSSCLVLSPCLTVWITETVDTGGTTPPTASTGSTGEIADTASPGYGSCLDWTWWSGQDSGGSGAAGGSGDPPGAAARLDRLAAEGVLPPDVVERLRRR